MRTLLDECLTKFADVAGDIPLIAAGHSEGAVVATLLARAEPSVRGVVLLAGPSVGILEIMIEQLPIMTPPNELDEARRVFAAVVAAIRETGAIPDDLRASPYARSLAQMDAPSLSYMRTCDAVDPAAELAEVTQPVLIVQGARDSSVPEHHAHRLRDARRAKRQLDTDLAVLTRLQHFFKPLPDGVTGAADFGLQGDVDARVAGAIEGWVRSVVTGGGGEEQSS
jgi:pimeloyl-ACP methyl ester carboxylesterase